MSSASPTWEKEVFDILHANIAELKSIFNQYSKIGGGGSGSLSAAETMQVNELTNLALDCGIASETFPMTRVINIFERADQVDGTLKASKADKRVTTGKNAKGGDGSLELHEFLEVVIMLAFHRANPKFGTVGNNEETAVEYPAPGCLDHLLKKCLLQNAKRDGIALVKSAVAEEPDVQVALWSYKSALLKEFRMVIGNAGASGQNLSMDVFLDDLFDRGIIRDQMVTPKSAVVGQELPQVHLNLSLLDAKAAFVTAQKEEANQGKAKGWLDFDEFVTCLALCGHVKYEEIKEMSLAQRVSGVMENYLGQKDECAIVTAAVVPQIERFSIAGASPLPGQPLAEHSLFIETWKALDLSSVAGFPAWEADVFRLLQPVFGDVSRIFYTYAKGIGAGAAAQTAELSDTMQENELASLVRDTGLATEAFPIARIHTLYTQVSTADQLHLPGFVTLLLLISVHRANPKLGSHGGPKTPAKPLPGCFEAILNKNILQSKKKEQQAAVHSELKTIDAKTLLRPYRDRLRAEFDAACAQKEKGRTLFGGLVMGVATLVSEFRERKVLGARQVQPKAAITGVKLEEVTVELAASDVERAFVSCQDGAGGDEGNATIDFNEFMMCLALCGHVKFEAVKDMSLEQRVHALVVSYLGDKDEAKAVSAAIAPPIARFDATGVEPLFGQSLAEHDKFMDAWRRMDLSGVAGFPLWEEEVFGCLQNHFTDLYSIFTYYAYSGDAAGSSSAETMQQTELIDLALDTGLASKAYPMTKIVSLFEAENKRSGVGDTDLELFEFLQLIVALSHARAVAEAGGGTAGGGKAGGGMAAEVLVPEALEALIMKHLSRSARLEEIKPLVALLHADVATGAVLKVHEPALKAFFAEGVARGSQTMSERGFLKQLSEASLMRAVIVPAQGSVQPELRCDLLWLDASAAFHACASTDSGAYVTDYASCLALCGMIKYSGVEPMSLVQQVAGFLANLAGRMDEADVVKTAFSGVSAEELQAAREAAAARGGRRAGRCHAEAAAADAGAVGIGWRHGARQRSRSGRPGRGGGSSGGR